MKLKVTPIMNVGIITDDNKQGSLPFYNIKVVVGTKVKNHLVNWTFGNLPDGGELTLENDLGTVKMAMFTTCKSIGDVCLRVIKHGDVIGKIRATLMDCPDNTPIMFVWPKSLAEDDVFFNAVELMKNGEFINKNIVKPKHSSKYGYVIPENFIDTGLVI